MPTSSRLATLVLLVLTVAVATPVLAYTIYLKDGSHLVAREPYRVEDGKAYIVLNNGTTTFIDASEIDVERTREANQSNLGSAVVLDEGEVREIPVDNEPEEEETSLADLITGGQAGTRRQAAVEAAAEAERRSGPQLEQTTAGYPDLRTLPRRSYTNDEIASEIQAYYRSQGLDEVQVFQGTEPGRPFVEVTAASEASVFRALAVGASAVNQLAERFPAQVRRLELLMVTPAGERAGQFVLSPETADLLLSKKVDVTTFFLRYVQF